MEKANDSAPRQKSLKSNQSVFWLIIANIKKQNQCHYICHRVYYYINFTYFFFSQNGTAVGGLRRELHYAGAPFSSASHWKCACVRACVYCNRKSILGNDVNPDRSIHRNVCWSALPPPPPPPAVPKHARLQRATERERGRERGGRPSGSHAFAVATKSPTRVLPILSLSHLLCAPDCYRFA